MIVGDDILDEIRSDDDDDEDDRDDDKGDDIIFNVFLHFIKSYLIPNADWYLSSGFFCNDLIIIFDNIIGIWELIIWGGITGLANISCMISCSS